MREVLLVALVPGDVGRQCVCVRLGRRVRLGQLFLHNVGQGVVEIEERRINCDVAPSVVGVGHRVGALGAERDPFR